MADVKPLNDDEREDLISYLDGELTDPVAQRKIEAQITNDPRIRAEADAFKKAWDLLDYLPKPEPSPNFTNRTLDRATAVRPTIPLPLKGGRSQRVGIALAWVAALLVAGVVGFGVAPSLPDNWKPAVRDPAGDADQQLARDLRLLERLGLYQQLNDFYFLNELDRPELFGDENAGN